MLTIQKYIKNPCAQLSIPYWKAKTIKLPENMKIVHDREYSSKQYNNYVDEKYFRLLHTLKKIEAIKLDEFDIITANKNHNETIVSIINDSYEDLQVNLTQIQQYRKTPVYNSNLWVLVREKETGKYVGCGIADYDTEVKELILEWIQVLPDYRQRKIGKFIINELLLRMKNSADFATVSGKVDHKSNPELLYRSCGFSGNDIWHVLYLKEM